MASVSLENVSKYYDSTPAILEVDLEVAEGEFVVLLGPSGSGKTTLLRMVAGFIAPTSGQIRLGGEDVTGLPPRKRDIGMVFQDYALFPNMTVEENIGFGLRERKTNRAVLARRVAECLALIRLEAFGKRYPGELSGGQQQRVALARALAFSPRLLLMDEPLGALDLKLREAMRGEIHRIQRAMGITTMLVTHDQEEAMSLADRIVVVGDGRIQQIGTPEQLYRSPANPFVAHFIGKINLLAGRVESVSDGVCTVRVGADITFSGMAHERLEPGQEVQLAIRPEALRWVDASDERFGRPVPATIQSRRFLGNLVHTVVRLPDGQELLAEHSGSAATEAGTSIWLTCLPGYCTIFPAGPVSRAATARQVA